MIYIDVAKFAQIVRNLVSNALKFTPRGGSVTVVLEGRFPDMRTHISRKIIGRYASVYPKDCDTAVLKVIDSGAGISIVSPPAAQFGIKLIQYV
jgi:signal transduction histidine kinase